MLSYIKLGIVVLLPSVLSLLLLLFQRTKAFGKLSAPVAQIMYGVLFGGLAIVGTEWGIPLNGAQMNCRDAAVLCAGLFFGSPSGIIAGLIGGIERWIAVAWGIGTFTRVGCTVSTIAAGFYAALLRHYVLEKKRPSLALSFMIGLVMETIHLSSIFITNMNNIDQAMKVVRSCTQPMLLANAISVMLASLTIMLVTRDRVVRHGKIISIVRHIQNYLLLAILIAFCVSTFFIYRLQTVTARTHVSQTLSKACEEVRRQAKMDIDEELINLCNVVSNEVERMEPDEIASHYALSAIDVIDRDGIIASSMGGLGNGQSIYEGRQPSAYIDVILKKGVISSVFKPSAAKPEDICIYIGVKHEDGCVRIGLNKMQYESFISDVIKDLTKYKTIETDGFCLLFDAGQKLVSAPGNGKSYTATDIFGTGFPKAKEMYNMPVGGVDCFCMYANADDYHIFAVIPFDDAMWEARMSIYANTFVEIIIFALLYVLIYQVLRRIVVDKLVRVNASLTKITNGDLDEVVNVRDSLEFVQLSDDINATVDTLKRYIVEASERIDNELKNATNIQISALPAVRENFTGHNEIELDAFMATAKAVGGDFYDFYMTDDDTFNFMIADVSGKGIPAAMFMMRSKTELKNLTESGIGLAEVFTSGNKHLCQGNDEEMFVTAWQGRLDLRNGELSFVNAGHNHPLLYHDGKFTMLKDRPNFVLGGMETVRYRCGALQLTPGDIIFLYTDGVPEATNASNELYGDERLLAIVNARRYDSMKELCSAIKQDVDAFVGEAPQFDDITMVAILYKGRRQDVVFHYDLAVLDIVPQFVEGLTRELEKLACPIAKLRQLIDCSEEIVTNIAKHAYPEGPGCADIRVREVFEPHAIEITFEDEGRPYNPLTKSGPGTTVCIKDGKALKQPSIMFVKQMMDEVSYRYEGKRNIFTIRRNFDDD